jgi:hypothetical protein
MDIITLLQLFDNSVVSLLYALFLVIWHKRGVLQHEHNQVLIDGLLLLLKDCIRPCKDCPEAD